MPVPRPLQERYAQLENPWKSARQESGLEEMG